MYTALPRYFLRGALGSTALQTSCANVYGTSVRVYLNTAVAIIQSVCLDELCTAYERLYSSAHLDIRPHRLFHFEVMELLELVSVLSINN